MQVTPGVVGGNPDLAHGLAHLLKVADRASGHSPSWEVPMYVHNFFTPIVGFGKMSFGQNLFVGRWGGTGGFCGNHIVEHIGTHPFFVLPCVPVKGYVG